MTDDDQDDDHDVDSVIMDNCDERDEHRYEYLDMDLEENQALASQWEKEDRKKEEEKFLITFPRAPACSSQTNSFQRKLTKSCTSSAPSASIATN